jgi:pimeloyl-ACP methyl ester carboxylesterase
MTPRRGYADGPFGQVHFQMLGDGVPLVLLHQAPMTSGQFDRVYAPLAARGLRAIGIDMPGFGMSDPTDFAPRVEDYAQAVPAVLDALGIDRAVVAGHHTGALVAVAAAEAFPDRVAGLIVHSPLLIDEVERQAYLAGHHQWELSFVPAPGGAHFRELAELREGFSAGSIGTDRISDYVVQAWVGRGKFWYGHHAAYQYRLEDSWPRIARPTCILTNTGDVLYGMAQQARTLRPDFAYAELEGGGVDIVDQQPEAWAELVANFARTCA